MSKMSKKRNAEKKQERLSGANHPSFKYNQKSQKRGSGGGGGRGSNGRRRNDQNDWNYGRNRNARSWTSDNGGPENWTQQSYQSQSNFPKFRAQKQQFGGTRNMSEYHQNYYYDYNDDQTALPQNVTSLQTPQPAQTPQTAQTLQPAQTPQTVQTPQTPQTSQTPQVETQVSETTAHKPTIVQDLTNDNATTMSNSAGANIVGNALTELRKDFDVPIRFPMESIENPVLKIKIEKTEQNENKPLKPQVKPESSSSGSSSSDEASKQEADAPKPAVQNHKKLNTDDKQIKTKTKAERKPKKLVEAVSKPKPASSSSSEDEETSSEAATSSSEDHATSKNAVATKKPAKRTKKDKKLKTERKLHSDEDVVCLGKKRNRFSLDDEDADSDATSSKSKKINDICILCDKKGHTSFECQMICKNCTKPYHNLKNCPQPANISLMMQNFMEFLMQQMSKYSPQAAYSLASFPQHLNANVANFETATSSQLVAPGSPSVSSTLGKRKRSQVAAKIMESVAKKLTKKRHNHKNNKKDILSDERSSATTSESETSSEISEHASETFKRKNSKGIAQEQAFVNPFPGQLAMPAYGAGLPGYGAAAAFNPMLPMLSQMMQNGYPVHGAFNFKQ